MATLTLFACTLPLIGLGSVQEPPPPATEQFLPDRVRAASATTAAVGLLHPLGVAGVLIQGQDTSVWTVEPPLAATPPQSRDRAPLLDPDVLWHVDDRKPLADINVNPGEVRAYYYAITVAHQTPADMLLKSARRDLSYLEIFEDTEQYRGQVIYVEGDLKLLRRYEPAARLKKEGVKDHYEGWIFDRRHPGQDARICLIFTELPPEIKLAENIDYPVKFAGYLFKRFRVRQPKSAFDAPLLIGRTIYLDRVPIQGSSAEAKVTFLIAFFAVGGLTVALIVGLTWWYRRNDQEVRQRLANLRPPEFTPLEDFEPTNGHPKG